MRTKTVVEHVVYAAEPQDDTILVDMHHFSGRGSRASAMAYARQCVENGAVAAWVERRMLDIVSMIATGGVPVDEIDSIYGEQVIPDSVVGDESVYDRWTRGEL